MARKKKLVVTLLQKLFEKCTARQKIYEFQLLSVNNKALNIVYFLLWQQ